MLSVSSFFTAWIVVMVSGALEVVFSVSMKLSDSYTKLLPSAVSVLSAVASVWLMSFTLKVLPLGTAYAGWAGVGAAGTALVGILWFNEVASLGRLVCLGAVIAGIVGLQLVEGA